MPYTLSKKDVEIVNAHLAKRRTKPGCISCGAENWKIPATVATLPFLNGHEMQEYEGCMPIITLVCAECGFVMPYAAKSVGIL